MKKNGKWPHFWLIASIASALCLYFEYIVVFCFLDSNDFNNIDLRSKYVFYTFQLYQYTSKILHVVELFAVAFVKHMAIGTSNYLTPLYAVAI